VVEALDTPVLRKARGAFFTPPAITEAIVHWAVRTGSDRILEPSCGEAAFLIPAALQIERLGVPVDGVPIQLTGIDLHAESTRRARSHLAKSPVPSEIRKGNFFDLAPVPTYDAVVGNPPYVRYQDFAGLDRSRAQERALEQGVRLSGLASSWAAFTVHASAFLNESGRLGLVIPGEFLNRDYAASVRSYLLQRFERVALAIFHERIFPGVLEEVVLLLAEGTGGTDHFALYDIANLDDLRERDFGSEPTQRWAPTNSRSRLTRVLGDERGSAVLDALEREGVLSQLAEWGTPRLGIVTGANKYFAVTKSASERHGFRSDELLPLCPPGSKHVRRLSFTPDDWCSMVEADDRGYLFRPETDYQSLSAGAKKYIDAGDEAGIASAYKCRVRSPWWRVPDMTPPDLFVTYMNHEAVQLCSNSAGVRCLNSLHGLRFTDRVYAPRASSLLPIGALSTASLASAEQVGRAFGGGMLQVLPREASRMLVPSKATLGTFEKELEDLAGDVETAITSGDLTQATALVDEVILGALSRPDRVALQKALAEFRRRRFTRNAGDRV
jgi:adenine-specific DNA-methyltransferase